MFNEKHLIYVWQNEKKEIILTSKLPAGVILCLDRPEPTWQYSEGKILSEVYKIGDRSNHNDQIPVIGVYDRTNDFHLQKMYANAMTHNHVCVFDD